MEMYRLSKQLKYHNLAQIKPTEVTVKSEADGTNNTNKFPVNVTADIVIAQY
jgi:hypothetical protein